jgi:hypothetical protein
VTPSRSATGCLFGPPLPIPNPTGTATSTCVVNVVSSNATGSGNCDGNIASLNLPLASGIYLTGDLDPTIAGIQPCPICTGGTCRVALTETGAPSACLADGAGHSATLVSIFCITPTFNGLVDGSADLPGPGAVSLPGTAQLLP